MYICCTCMCKQNQGILLEPQRDNSKLLCHGWVLWDRPHNLFLINYFFISFFQCLFKVVWHVTPQAGKKMVHINKSTHPFKLYINGIQEAIEPPCKYSEGKDHNLYPYVSFKVGTVPTCFILGSWCRHEKSSSFAVCIKTFLTINATSTTILKRVLLKRSLFPLPKSFSILKRALYFMSWSLSFRQVEA